MKVSLLLSLMVAASTLAASDLSVAPAARPRLTDDRKHRVDETASDPSQQKVSSASGDGLIVLAPVKVTGTYQLPLRRPEDQAPANRPFTWRDGGTLVKHEGPRVTSEVKFQYNLLHGGFDFLSFSW